LNSNLKWKGRIKYITTFLHREEETGTMVVVVVVVLVVVAVMGEEQTMLVITYPPLTRMYRHFAPQDA
jgi:hypothetical protein